MQVGPFSERRWPYLLRWHEQRPTKQACHPKAPLESGVFLRKFAIISTLSLGIALRKRKWSKRISPRSSGFMWGREDGALRVSELKGFIEPKVFRIGFFCFFDFFVFLFCKSSYPPKSFATRVRWVYSTLRCCLKEATMLQVNEIFGPTIQGEGKSVGKRVLFLRLANCNLHCRLCDTDYTWRFNNRHPHANNVVYERKDEVHRMDTLAVFRQLTLLSMTVIESFVGQTKALVISGGEPFLQQKQLIPLLQRLKQDGWWVEIETNGTIAPRAEFVQYLDQINCSPKLDSSFSGESRRIRIRETALKVLSEIQIANFKFVVSEPENLTEALQLIQDFQIKEVWLMPEGRTKEEIEKKKQWIRSLCAQHGFNFSSRLHIELWGSKRAV